MKFFAMYKILATFKGRYKHDYPHLTGKMGVRVLKRLVPSHKASMWLS